MVSYMIGFPGGSDGRVYLQYRRPRFDPWVGKIPWRRKWQPTPVFWPGKAHGWRSLVGYSPWGSQRVWHNRATLLLHLCDCVKWPLWKKGNHLGGCWTFKYSCYLSSLELSLDSSCRVLLKTFYEQQDEFPTISIALPIQQGVPSTPTREEKDWLKAIFSKWHLLDIWVTKQARAYVSKDHSQDSKQFLCGILKEPKLLPKLQQCHF